MSTQQHLSIQSKLLSQCAKEQVHIPGAIQPHGILTVLEPGSFRVLAVSDNTYRLIGRIPSEILGQPITSSVAPTNRARLLGILETTDFALHNPFKITFESGREFYAIVHESQGRIILEFEPTCVDDDFAQTHLYNRVLSTISRLRIASSLNEMYQHTVREIRAMTKFDRVLIYAFKPDWSGEVIAEDHADGANSYLGLRFPASDIPEQARALYTKCRVRMVPTSTYEPSSILGMEAGNPIDLTHACLRSISPVHLEYMRNMGVTASLGISLLDEGRLWGLITCNQESSERFVPYEIRLACGLVGEIVSSTVASKEHLEAAGYENTSQSVQAKLLHSVARDSDLVSGLTQHASSLLDIMEATGAALWCHNELHCLGATPSTQGVLDLVAWLNAQGANLIVEESLVGRYAPAMVFKDVACGLVASAIPFGKSSVVEHQPWWLLWFRPEIAQTVAWGGDPSKLVTGGDDKQLHPRTSFALWREQVGLHCAPFSQWEIDAAIALARGLKDIVLEIEASRQLSIHAKMLAETNQRLALQIADTQKIEVELRRSQKLEAIGRLAAGIAHEINTPLQFVSSGLEFIEECFNDLLSLLGSKNMTPPGADIDLDYIRDRAPKAIARSREGLLRIGSIVQAMKSFARTDGGEKILTDINEALRNTVEVAQGNLRDVAHVSFDLGNMPLLLCYPSKLNQAFLSLVMNASLAIKGTLSDKRQHGSIVIKSSRLSPTADTLSYVICPSALN